MKALVYEGPKSLVYRDEPEPHIGNGEVLVRIEAAGVCGSDIHAYLGHDERRPAPLILGHEACGQIVRGPRRGERVAINPLVTCGICHDCLSGRSNLCSQREIISLPPRGGAFAEFASVPDGNLVPIPEDMSSAVAALSEPVAIGIHGVLIAQRLSNRPLNEARALVIGGGAVGLSTALVLSSHGCREIFVAETNAGRQKTITEALSCEVYNPNEGLGPEPGSMDVVVDAVGGKTSREAAVAAARPGSVIVHIGLLQSTGEIDVRRITLQEIIFAGCYTYTMVDFQAALNALHSGALGSLTWFETRTLADGAAAFEDLLSGQITASKIILRP